jgi:hypothetical protein
MSYVSGDLESWLTAHGYAIVVVPDNGDCVPSCFSVFLTGENRMGWDVRRIVTESMCINADLLSFSCPDIGTGRDAGEASSAGNVIVDSLTPQSHVGDHFISEAMKVAQLYCEVF